MEHSSFFLSKANEYANHTIRQIWATVQSVVQGDVIKLISSIEYYADLVRLVNVELWVVW